MRSSGRAPWASRSRTNSTVIRVPRKIGLPSITPGTRSICAFQSMPKLYQSRDAISVPLAIPELAGRQAGLLFEDDAHVLDMFEAGSFGDRVQRQVGLGEQFLHTLDSRADDLLVGHA